MENAFNDKEKVTQIVSEKFQELWMKLGYATDPWNVDATNFPNLEYTCKDLKFDCVVLASFSQQDENPSITFAGSMHPMSIKMNKKIPMIDVALTELKINPIIETDGEIKNCMEILFTNCIRLCSHIGYKFMTNILTNGPGSLLIVVAIKNGLNKASEEFIKKISH